MTRPGYSRKQLNVRRLILHGFALVLSLILIIIFTLGSYDYFRNVEANKCEMTYMFEFPQYIKIELNNEEDHNYPMYGLYAYTEGKHIESVRKLKFTGIPVLFLPGNSGSYKQVRSFASVALRKWLNSRTPFHFDFFTIDFNDEISGLYGYVLKRQSEYAKHAINRIVSFYEDFHHVVVIGHSMGGIVAKTLVEGEAQVQMIYTLATPHLQPLIILDPEIDLFYYYVSKNWTRLRSEKLSEVTLVSVAGGDRDLIIRTKLTRWLHNDIHTSTTSMPTVWASTDHLCIVWCKQVVMSVVRSLFDMVETRSKFEYYAITQNTSRRHEVLNYHFLQRTSGKSYHEAHPNEIEGTKPPSALWTETLARDYCQPATTKLTYLMFPLKIFERSAENYPKNTRILISTANTNPKNWIFGCKSQTIVNNVRICSMLINLSNQTTLIPSFHRRRKVVHLNYEDVKKFSHIVVKLNPFNFPCCVNTDAYNIMDRSKIIGDQFATEDKIFYNFHFPLAYNISRFFAWRFHAVLSDKCDGHHNSVGLFRFGDYQTHNFFKNESVLVRFGDMSSKSGDVELYLDKSCKYELSAQIAWLESLGQIFRSYWHLLPSYISSIVLMSLAFQPPTGWGNFPKLLLRNAYYLTIIPGYIIAFGLVFIPNDYPTMMDPEEYNVLVPFGIYLVSFAIVFSFGVLSYVALFTIGNSYHSIITRFLTKKLGNVPEKVAELALDYTFDKFPVTLAVVILAVSMSSCGAMGLSVGLFLYMIKVFKSYENILESLVRERTLNLEEIFSTSNFHFHCGMLWCVITFLNLPSLLYWINNFSFDEAPVWDISLYTTLMLIPALAILWQNFVPQFNPRLWKVQRCMCYLSGLFAVIWATHRLYLLSFLILVVILSLAGCQVISLMASPNESDESQHQESGTDVPVADDISNSSEEEAAENVENSMDDSESG